MSGSAELQLSATTEQPLWRDYFELCKPKVVLLMMVTAIVGMLLAPDNDFTWLKFIAANIGIALAAASAAAINHTVDKHIDAIMQRTRRRPIVRGRILPLQACLFSLILFTLSMFILLRYTNPLTALLSFLSLIGYAIFYTLFLKRATPQNIVIGGAAGAAPPVLGWTAMSGTLDAHSLLLMLIIFIWTPPHFWALAIHRVKDYAQAGIPMLPVTHGIDFTKYCITLYTVLLIAVTLLPFAVAMSGWFYLHSAVLLGVLFLWHALNLQFRANSLSAITTFKYSCWYLLLLFASLLIDRVILFA